MNEVLSRFSAPTREWFSSSFSKPTKAQDAAWAAIAENKDALVVAPTGSGKTLAAFLWSIDQLMSTPLPPKKQRLRVLYVSPLKALAVDVDKNLRSPLRGIEHAARRLGTQVPELTVGVRTGDTPAEERRRFATQPPDILITTPESLFLLLTSAAREALSNIDTVIIDEVHAVAGTKRGAHLALSLERLDASLGEPARRIGLSATVRPLDEVARFLGGSRPVEIVAPVSQKEFDLRVVVPVEDMENPSSDVVPPVEDELGIYEGSAAGAEAQNSVWPHVEAQLLSVIEAHTSTIVFVNSRRLAERLCSRLNELAGREIARAHHGSVAREQRSLIEDDLKAGRLPAVVATSSLELGIDMGAVDLVVQVGAPDSVASGLQRVGRAGHQVGAISRGLFFPRFRADLLESAVVVERMARGEIEATQIPANPLDVLAQQVVAMVAMDDHEVDGMFDLVRRAAPFSELPRSAFESVLDMLSGRYPSDEFAELRPRLNWDRVKQTLSGRSNAQRLAVTSGGTIPDRGLFGVFIAGEKGGRVGELDEEMVYESRPGDVFLLGSSSWQIQEITHDRVLVTPAPGQPGKMPFWHGDAPGRPVELGAAIGQVVRELSGALAENEADVVRSRFPGLDANAVANLIEYVSQQKMATGVVPDDRTIVVERFRDELGDWRICIHSFFGARVHAPWAQAIEARLRDSFDSEVQTIYSDDGIVIRLPEALDAPQASSIVIDPEEVTDLVVGEVGGSALFASRFREAAARALLLPRRRPGTRTPLWQQRQRSAGLLSVASKYGTFPIILETFRECLQDVFDLPALKDLLASIARREVRVVEVETPSPSPFASSLLFGYISAFMYEGDAPLAERRAQALSLDRSLLAELLGREELRELIDAGALAELELELQRLTDERKARSIDHLHDMLRDLGDLDLTEIRARIADPADAQAWVDALDRRIMTLPVAGVPRYVAVEDAARFRDALGTPMPPGVPYAFLEPVADPLGDLVARYARTHGPFKPEEVARRLGLGVSVVHEVLGRLSSSGRVVDGEFRPGGTGTEWIDVEVLRRLRRRSLAALRKEIEPAPVEAMARFYLAWQGLGSAAPYADTESLYRVVEQLQGIPLPASSLETQILPARVRGYSPALLDELAAAGEIVWAGAGAIGSDDGWVVLSVADAAPLLLPEPMAGADDQGAALLDALRDRGALFFRQLSEETRSTDDQQLLLTLWDLVWKGWITNDTIVPLRALLGRKKTTRQHAQRRQRGPSLPSRLGPPAGAGRWALTPQRHADATRRTLALSEQLLSRYGIVTNGIVNSERVAGGFSTVYPVLKAMEERGACRRGYFVEGLGGAQFALPGAVDRMRTLIEIDKVASRTDVLAATDPANPYGAALAWPQRESGHRAGRKAGAIVVLVDGELVLYVERGGRSLLGYTDDEAKLQPAVDALALAAREGVLGKLHVETADGEGVYDTPFAKALVAAGFRPSSKGLRLRA